MREDGPVYMWLIISPQALCGRHDSTTNLLSLTFYSTLCVVEIVLSKLYIFFIFGTT